jgi:hypothetical protein
VKTFFNVLVVLCCVATLLLSGCLRMPQVAHPDRKANPEQPSTAQLGNPTQPARGDGPASTAGTAAPAKSPDGEARDLVEAAINPATRKDALAKLAEVRPDLRRQVITLLVDDDVRAVSGAAQELARMGPKGRPAMPALLHAVKRFPAAPGQSGVAAFRTSINSVAVVAVVKAMAAVDPADPAFAEAAQAARQYGGSQSDMNPLRLDSFGFLAAAAKAQPRRRDEIVAGLIADLDNRERGADGLPLGAHAARALGGVGPDAAKAIPALKKATEESPVKAIREAAEAALKVIETPGKIETPKKTGKTGAAAYDDFRGPQRSQFVKEWEEEVKAVRNAMEADKERLSHAANTIDKRRYSNYIEAYAKKLEELEKNDPPYRKDRGESPGLEPGELDIYALSPGASGRPTRTLATVLRVNDGSTMTLELRDLRYLEKNYTARIILKGVSTEGVKVGKRWKRGDWDGLIGAKDLLVTGTEKEMYILEVKNRK